jgi:hypothetical protein
MSICSTLAQVFNAVLQPEGFQRRSRSWYRMRGGIYAVVNLQKSSFDETCYVNVGFSPAEHVKEEWQPEQMCQVRFRADALRAISNDDLALLDPSVGGRLDDASWSANARERIVLPVATSVVGVANLDNLRSLIRNDLSGRLFIHKEIRELIDRSK